MHILVVVMIMCSPSIGYFTLLRIAQLISTYCGCVHVVSVCAGRVQLVTWSGPPPRQIFIYNSHAYIIILRVGLISHLVCAVAL